MLCHRYPHSKTLWQRGACRRQGSRPGTMPNCYGIWQGRRSSPAGLCTLSTGSQPWQARLCWFPFPACLRRCR